ncbi:signal peptidase I [compost metagenome]|uniref:S26 family signal peptidase n=1 Tax=Pseudomonas sp. R5(2019) TaxID=2697566 RepID=UPI000FBAB72E|nr:S26 family signal peptidase [Pseudomonas sp. R5(2019)]NBA95302.1 signal peptidase I [Pseudomonas sp. R5(2019)]
MKMQTKLDKWKKSRLEKRAKSVERRIMLAVNAANLPRRSLIQRLLHNPNKKPWKTFAPKVVLVCTLVAPVFIYAFDRYSVGIDPQNKQCLPWRIFLIDKYDKTPVRGETFAFKSEYMERYGQGIKFVDGVPGDLVVVDAEKTTVNGKVVGHGLMFAEKLGFTPQQLSRSGHVPAGKIWLMGRTDNSFDSRYWNSISASSIIGRAYPIW